MSANRRPDTGGWSTPWYPPRTAQEARLRLSDNEREAAARDLGEHFAQGRLTVDEHHERVEAVWAARTRGELPELFADLPAPRGTGPTPAGPRRPVPTRGVPRSGRGLPGWLVVLLAIGLVLSVIAHFPVFLFVVGVWWLLSRHAGCGGRNRPAGG